MAGLNWVNTPISVGSAFQNKRVCAKFQNWDFLHSVSKPGVHDSRMTGVEEVIVRRLCVNNRGTSLQLACWSARERIAIGSLI